MKRTLGVSLVTQDAHRRFIAWGDVEGANQRALVGIAVDDGTVRRIDLTKFGLSHIQLTRGADGNLYLYTGRPGRFLKYDVKKESLIDLGVPYKNCSYWLGSAVGPDGRFYIGSYPATRLVSCDPATGRVEDLGSLAIDRRECYIVHPAVSDDNVVYCPVGLHHQELWAFDLKARIKRQILPSDLAARRGAPEVWVGIDGQVYGRSGTAEFRCKPDSIEPGKTARRRSPLGLGVAGDWFVGPVDQRGKLHLRHRTTGEKKVVATNYQGVPAHIYSIGCVHQGRLYGGTFEPADVFSLDLVSRQLRDLGSLTGGGIQVYDVLSHPRGLFLASYTGGCLDFFDPSQPVKRGRNPRAIAKLTPQYLQERPIELTLGPDGLVYTGTVPVKGQLGGALVRIDPNDFSVKVWRNLVPNQSIFSCAPVPETGHLFVVSSISGGSSAIPSEKEAVAFLWDTRTEKIDFQFKPVPGAASYGKVVRAANGLVFGLAGRKYYAFDPVKRRVVVAGNLPVRQVHWPGLNDVPVGATGLIYGLGDDAVFALDPATLRAEIVARDPSIAGAQGLLVTEDETLYYGSGGVLMRSRLRDPDALGKP